jgi:hypothetical protein
MKKIKIIAGITWALICLALILILFPGLGSFSATVSKLPFMKINPNYSGGPIAGQVVSPCCTLEIRKPVFDGLFSERNIGFIQLDWHGDLPDFLTDTVDFNFDSIPDFSVKVDRKTSKTELYPVNPMVKNIGISSSTSYGWSVRVELKK